eukprot:scaffold14458_cov107-Isochrysis_galbana.AAC.5
MPARRALSPHASVHPSNNSTASAPAPAAERSRVPRLPGSETRSRIRTSEAAGGTGSEGSGSIASTPCQQGSGACRGGREGGEGEHTSGEGGRGSPAAGRRDGKGEGRVANASSRATMHAGDLQVRAEACAPLQLRGASEGKRTPTPGGANPALTPTPRRSR